MSVWNWVTPKRVDKALDWLQTWTGAIVSVALALTILIIFAVWSSLMVSTKVNEGEKPRNVIQFYRKHCDEPVFVFAMVFLGAVLLFPPLVVLVCFGIIGPYEKKLAVRDRRIFSLF